MPPPEHSADDLVALNADIVGYSRLMADDFEATAATVQAFRHLVEDAVSAGGGILDNFVGDNFMAVFGDAGSALQTAIAITSAIEERNDAVDSARKARFRMGIDQGPIVVTEGQYQGEALNVAARIQAMAPPGGISVSGSVYRALDEPALRFRPTGEHHLKHIPEPVDVYEFADFPTDGELTPTRTMLALETPTVAVLPIHAEKSDDVVQAAAEIVRADLVHRLASVPDLQVLDAGDAPRVDTPPATARYMLETGLHQFGDTLRLFATLFDVTTMNVVKSHKWTTTTDEIVALSEQVADDIARSIEVELIVGTPAGLYAELDDPEAIEKVYLGWYHLRSESQQGWAKAMELFGAVAESHPDQPYGHVLAAFALWAGASNGWAGDPEEALAEARGLARRGMEIGDPTGMAKAVDAAVLMSMGDVDGAMQALDQLEIVRPTCDVTYGLEGSLRRYMGQWERAVDLLDVAMSLTGINKPWYPTVKACSLFIGNRLEQAAAVAESVLEYQPANLEALLVLAAAQVELGMDRRAAATAQRVRDTFPSVDVDEWIDQSPYQRRAIVDRWRGDLEAVGLARAG